jgi:predicted ATPase
MRVDRIGLSRFKKFQDYSLDLTTEIGLPNIVLLVGDNGTGKTTILQAIAATLGTATQQIRSPEQLDWPGFMSDGLSASHRGFSEVRLDVVFSQDELDATAEFYEKSDYSTLENATYPSKEPEVSLVWNTSPASRYTVATDPRGASHYFQFQGRRYAYNLLYNRNALEGMFERIGGVFWYTEQRTSYSLAPFAPEGGSSNGKSPIRQIDDEDSMRDLLTKWFAFARNDKPHKLQRFNDYYSKLFPGRKLSRIEDAYGASASPIYFYDGKNEYDISELSGGERALMPLLLDFVEWGINNSVILIDEIELHLHPPLQQALLTLLPQLGHNNQFIVTTHSNAVASLVPESSIKRVGINEHSY